MIERLFEIFFFNVNEFRLSFNGQLQKENIGDSIVLIAISKVSFEVRVCPF